MAKSKPKKAKPKKVPEAKQAKRPVDSLLDQMIDGQEYASLVDCAPRGLDLKDELRRAITDIETIRQRPLSMYVSNIIKPPENASISIENADDLPFAEMISSVPSGIDAIDILTVTPGGIAQQVSQFVSKTRSRFQDVSFILPYMAMSAGTIWVLSGNEIWMDSRAFLGPIDPQVQAKDGKFLPAQALQILLKKIQEEGQAKMNQGQNPDWTDIQILRNIDAREIGNTISLSEYSIQLATKYLEEHKFRDWTKHEEDGSVVTPQERLDAAKDSAQKLCSHEIWKAHGHGITREVAWEELKIKIDHPENIPGLERAIRRLWALLRWIFDATQIAKIFLSNNYAIFKLGGRA